MPDPAEDYSQEEIGRLPIAPEAKERQHRREWYRQNNMEDAAVHIEQLEDEVERLRTRLLTAAGDDLCRLSQEEIKAMTAGEVPIPPREIFLESCGQFHDQVARTAGVQPNCLTLAQLLAENEQQRMRIEQLEAEVAPFRPMTIEEAEKAFDEAPDMPLSEDEVEHGVKYATDAEYRAEHNHQMYLRQHGISRGFKAELDRLRRQLQLHQQGSQESGDLFCWCVENLPKFPPVEGEWVATVKQLLKGNLAMQNLLGSYAWNSDQAVRLFTQEGLLQGTGQWRQRELYGYLRAMKAAEEREYVLVQGLAELAEERKSMYQLQAELDNIRAQLAGEGQGSLEHLLALASLGKHTTLIGRSAVRRLHDQIERLEDVAGWAQAVLTALNTGDVRKDSLLHHQLRTVLTKYREDFAEEDDDGQEDSQDGEAGPDAADADDAAAPS